MWGWAGLAWGRVRLGCLGAPKMREWSQSPQVAGEGGGYRKGRGRHWRGRGGSDLLCGDLSWPLSWPSVHCPGVLEPVSTDLPAGPSAWASPGLWLWAQAVGRVCCPHATCPCVRGVSAVAPPLSCAPSHTHPCSRRCLCTPSPSFLPALRGSSPAAGHGSGSIHCPCLRGPRLQERRD